jgi:endonuclease YncB( thermonuclease family)
VGLVAAIAAPEIRGPEKEAGLAAKAHAETLLPIGATVLVTSQAKPTFERTVGSIRTPHKGDLGELMIRAGHATRV